MDMAEKKVGNTIVRGLNCKKKYSNFAFSSPLVSSSIILSSFLRIDHDRR